MSPDFIVFFMAGILVVGLFMGHPLAVVLVGTAVLGAVVAGKTMALGVVVSRVFGEVLDNYTLIAIPLFILMARFLSDSEVTDKKFGALRLLMARVRGGRALAVVFVSVLRGATTGSICASSSAPGGRGMGRRRGYAECAPRTCGGTARAG